MTIGTPAPHDPTAASGIRQDKSSRYVLAASILGSSLAFIDGSVVNVALPAIESGLQSGGANISWALTAYLIPLGALTLLGGAIGDHVGRRRSFIFGIVAFVAASLICAGAPTFSILIAGRALQGIAAALLMPNSLAMLGNAFQGDRRSSAIATWAAAGSLTGAIGPLVGGALVDSIGWRAIFLLNIPVGVVAVWLAAAFVNGAQDQEKVQELDWPGALTATAALALLTWSLTEAAKPDSSSTVIGISLVIVASLGGLFAFTERARGPRALVPPSIFATSAFTGLTLLTLFLYTALGGLITLLPFFLIRYADYSASMAGAALLPISLIIGTGSRLVANISSRVTSRLLLSAGSVTVSIGFFLYSEIGNPISYWRDILPGTLLIAVGMALCVAPLTTAVMNSVDAAHLGAASGLNSATARVGGLIASALLAFVFIRQNSNDQLIESFKIAAIAAAVLCIAAAASAAILVRPPDKSPDDGDTTPLQSPR